MLPPLTKRQIARLPRTLQDDHARWIDKAPAAVAETMRERARQLALSLVELGEDGAGTERQLHRWRFHPALASEATAWALGRHAVAPARQGRPHERANERAINAVRYSARRAITHGAQPEGCADDERVKRANHQRSGYSARRADRAWRGARRVPD